MSQDEVFRIYIIDELSRYFPFDDVRRTIWSISPQCAKELCSLLSALRVNNVFGFIKDCEGEDWVQVQVKVDQIKLNQINDNVNPLLQKHQFMLKPCSEDPAIQNAKEFAGQNEMKSQLFLAGLVGACFELQDGNHRAFCLAREGAGSLSLLIPKAFQVRVRK